MIARCCLYDGWNKQGTSGSGGVMALHPTQSLVQSSHREVVCENSVLNCMFDRA